ncbi:MAG: rane protein involved in the export of O-antigen and teichoic acid-like protein, partial [Acidimicrobiales bacterium]|nr:rane protein involved in the export of O-antigen and teichoic acid-like protein [Acidimicrobiales bacterium]
MRLDLGRPASLSRSGYALLLSSVITSALGLVYWFLAARLIAADELGRGAALVSAMVLVTSLATAGLKRGLMLFVAMVGPGARRFVVHVYAAGLLITLAFGAVFVAGFAGLSRELDLVNHGWVGPTVFLLSTLVWAVFVLQDAVLIGSRRSTLVPVSNAAFSVAKIVVLLSLLAFVDQDLGVLLSWVLPALATGVVVNWWLARRGLERDDRPHAIDPPTLGQVARFTGAEYVAALSWLSAVYLTPLLVLARAGATSNAHFYLAFQIAYALFLVSSNISDALVADAAEVASSGTALAAKVRKASRQIALVLVPGAALAVVAAPWVMAAFGNGYRAEGTIVLRLLAIAAVPNAITTVMVAIAHVRRRMWLVMVVEATMAALTLVLSWLLLGHHGVAGVAWAWLIAQCATALLATVLTVQAEAPSRRELRLRLVGWASSGRGALARVRCERHVPRWLAQLPAGAVPPGPRRLLACQHDLAVVQVGSSADAVVVRLAVGAQGRAVIRAHVD